MLASFRTLPRNQTFNGNNPVGTSGGPTSSSNTTANSFGATLPLKSSLKKTNQQSQPQRWSSRDSMEELRV